MMIDALRIFRTIPGVGIFYSFVFLSCRFSLFIFPPSSRHSSSLSLNKNPSELVKVTSRHGTMSSQAQRLLLHPGVLSGDKRVLFQHPVCFSGSGPYLNEKSSKRK